MPGLTVQPDLRYVIRPNGGINERGRRLREALVLGLRTTISC